MPCKHFLSVFRHSDVSFESLPDKYRNNPIFSIDMDCLGIHLSNVRSCAEDSNLNRGEEDMVAEDNEPLDKSLGDETETSIEPQATTGKRLREIIMRISTLSYLIQDNEILQTARADLEKVAFFMSVNCPKDAGLPLEPETKVKKTVKRKRKSPIDLHELPKKKKKPRNVKGND